MSYSDYYMGEFLEKVLADPQLENTIIAITPDHGINYYAPHNIDTQNQTYEDLVWIPIALIGKKWNRSFGVDDEVRQLADIGPTILDRLGINVPNSFVGHSLLSSHGVRLARAFFQNSNGGLSAGVREGKWKFWMFFETGKKYLFDLETDRQESENLADDEDKSALVARLSEMVQSVYARNTLLIRDNRIYDPKHSGMSTKKDKINSR